MHLCLLQSFSPFGLRDWFYLALAIGRNVTESKQGFNSAAMNLRSSSRGKVIATEKEPSKAAEAQKNWDKAGEEIEGVIDLRIGDLRETLAGDLGSVDFLLLDSM